MAAGTGIQLVNPNTNTYLGAIAIESDHNVAGGRYVLTAHASAWNASTISLQIQAGDGLTWIDCGANTVLSADGNGYVDLPHCRVRMHLQSGAGPTGLYAALARVTS